MKLVIIHGPPGVGKLTTATALAEITGYPVLHNHLTLNVARALFEIGDERLNRLHFDLRLTLVEHAAMSEQVGAILTLVYAKPDSVAHVRDIAGIARDYDSEVHYVYLTCEVEELYRRVQDAGRRRNDKLRSLEKLKHLMATHDYPPVDGSQTLVIDNTECAATDSARRIADHFAL